jgi:hypothetical protein
MITKEDKELMAEIVADSIALRLLKDKCVWEAMSRYAVLSEWGDPRNWPAYKADKAAEAPAGAEE